MIEKRIKKHSILCKSRSPNEIGLECEIMTINNTPYTHLSPLRQEGFKTYKARELHVLNCLENRGGEKKETTIIF